jgi:lysophospholipase L1-like esterase
LSTLPEKYKPDIIINYQGWNDIKNYHLANDQGVYLEHGFLQRTNLKVNRKASLSEYSFIFFIAKKIRSKIISSNNPKKPLPITDGTVDSLYVKNLKTIRALGKYMNAKQIFVPQLMNFKWLKDRHNIENGWTTTIANQDMPQLIQNFNKLMYKTVPSEKDIITLDSIWQVRSWEERHFVDEGHFSKSGGEAFSELLIKSIRQLESQERDSN